MKMSIPYFFGGGRRGVSEEVETLGEALPLLLTTKGSQKLMIYMQFSFSTTPPPQVSGSAPGHYTSIQFKDE